VNILQLISSAGYYGAENLVVNLAKSLDKMGHRSTFGLFSNTHRPENDVAEIAKGHGLAVETIVCKGRMDWNAVRAISACVKKHEIDVVHTHGYKADAYALAAARRIRTPLVATCHNWLQHTASLRVYQLLDVLCLRHFDMAVAVSADVAAILRRSGVPTDRIATIANGIDISVFQAARATLAARFRKGSGLIVGMVGRLEPNKGQEYLLRAAPAILAQFPDTVFLLVGDGPSRGELENLVQQLRIGENVIFLGKRRDMPEVYASMDIFALPSLEEGMPLVILEALAAGKPVVATPVGDIPKLIRHQETGFLVNPQDVAGLRDAILRLIAQPELRDQLAANGHARVEHHYSSDAMARQYENVYESICAQRAAA
jgi:glycosyltransferase involved in cell wall biosynthesis